MEPRGLRFLALALFTGLAWAGWAADPPDVYSEELSRLRAQLQSPVTELRVAAIRGLAWMRAWEAEDDLLSCADDADPFVRQELAYTLGRVGGPASVSALLEMREDPDPRVRAHAEPSLRNLTQRDEPWADAWTKASPQEVEAHLLASLKRDPSERKRALRALECYGTAASEGPLLSFIAEAEPPLDGVEQRLAIAVLERIGTDACLPFLDAVAVSQPTAAWALGRIGGPAAEEALLKVLGRFGTWDPQHVINLDRLHSRRCGPFAPLFIQSYGCITFRGQPENLVYDPTPLQRACTNLLIRSGRSEEIVELVLREMEGQAEDSAIPEDLRPLMVALRDELAPGFVRNDGVTTSQPMAAMSHLVRDRRLAPRLIPLLEHPAYVARVYAAMALGRLGAVEALPAFRMILDEGYPFDDTETLVSGKHFGDSQSVRWKGFLCMALGRMGGEQARLLLEEICVDPERPRDLRFGALVGLGFLGSEASRPAIERVAREDLVWRIRVEAEEILHRLDLATENATRDAD